MRKFRVFVAACAVAVVAACQSAGMLPVDTFNKKVAAAYATVQTVAESAGAAYKAGKITDADRLNVVNTSRTALVGIQTAESIYKGACPAGSPATCESPAATDKLTATLTVLQALQAYLATQGAK